MALELYMVGLIVRDMPAAVAFYRRLGVEIPERAEQQAHVEVKMGNMTFFLDSRPDRWDPGLDSPPPEVPAPSATDGRYPMVLEFYLKAQAALEAKYLEMVDAGYHSFRAPYATTFGMCFAMLKDPDGNTVLLSADATPAEAASG